ncbi:MAG: hypothetical protein IT363_13165 [Methanoregulaceae archaeon]|nr:hypothetical protein [Methanoregulaceae archaeon]
MTALAVDDQGSIWAGTSGGLVQWTPDGRARLWTRADGLPGLRVRQLQAGKDGLRVLADGTAVLRGGRFDKGDHPIPVRAAHGLPLPGEGKSSLSTVSVGLPGPPVARAKVGSQWVWAVPESGLLTLSRGKGTPFEPQPPTKLLTSLAVSREGHLLAGTAGQGVLRLTKGKWESLRLPAGSLEGADATALIPNGDRLWVAPREGASFTLNKQQSAAKGAPWRTAVTWNGQDLVRRADGRLAFIDAQGRELPSTLVLPRVNANAIWVEGGTLFVAQPGGWSEFAPGEPPRHRFDLPELQGAPTTTIYADERMVAIGTQDRGLILVDRPTGEVRHLHEVHGLTDDWITALAPDNRGLLIGTFVGGLLRWDGERVTQVGLKGGCITRLLVDGARTWVGSLAGIFEWNEGVLSAPAWAKQIEPDVTDIAVHDGRLWIAAGGALFEIRFGLTRS